MSSINRPLRTCLLILALGWCLTPVGASAQEAPFGEVALPPSPILIDLADAVVRIVVDDALEPELRWRRVRPDTPGSAELSVVHVPTSACTASMRRSVSAMRASSIAMACGMKSIAVTR